MPSLPGPARWWTGQTELSVLIRIGACRLVTTPVINDGRADAVKAAALRRSPGHVLRHVPHWEAIHDDPIVGRVYQDCHLWPELRWLDGSDLATKAFLTLVAAQIDAEPNTC